MVVPVFRYTSSVEYGVGLDLLVGKCSEIILTFRLFSTTLSPVVCKILAKALSVDSKMGLS